MRSGSFKRIVVGVGIGFVLLWGFSHFYAYAREKAQQRECMANLRLISRAIQLYEEDYETTMPWGSGGRGEPTGAYSWLDLLDPYMHLIVHMQCSHGEQEQDEALKMEAVVDCPSAPCPHEQPITYGYNRYIGKSKQAQNPLIVLPVKIKYPALTIRITETLRPQPNAFPEILDSRIEGTFAPVPDWKAAGLSGPLYAPGWHNGKNNVLWVDGHVSTMTKEEVMLTDRNPDPNVWARLSPKPH